MISKRKGIENDDRDLDELIAEKHPPFRLFEHTGVSKQYHFYISGPIMEAQKYTDMIHILRTAAEEDTIYIYLNSTGGILATGVQIINAIRNSDAHVITSIESEIYSLASMIFLAGKSYMVNDNCLMMLHQYGGGGSQGKGHEQVAMIQAVQKWFHEIMRDVCMPFINDAELNRILKGEDMWFGSAEIKQRLIKAAEIRKAESRTPTKKKLNAKKTK